MTILLKMLCCLTPLAVLTSLAAQDSRSLTPNLPQSSDPASLAANMASTYVALDRWAYAAFDRLAALGVVQSAFAGLRPWTRMDCARLLREIEDQQAGTGSLDDEAADVDATLAAEFRLEMERVDGSPNRGAQMESLYLRSDGIAGKPINDGFHFAQTEVNNFGRPYGEGLNSYTGASVRAVYAPFAGYVRAEVQHAGTQPTVASAAQAAIALADFTQSAQLGLVASLSRGRLLDAYVSVGLRNYQLSFGRQSLWWGPGKGGPMLWSDNAEPITMLRLDRVRPLKLPSFAGLLGPIRGQFFIGRLEGQQFVHSDNQTTGQPGVSYPDQPFIHGEKVSFKPTQNFEFSISRTVIFGGSKFPVTFSSFWRSLVSTSTAGGTADPGDRRSAVDASYRVPGLRDWLTVYIDTFTDDQPFPLAYPRDSAWSPGVYLPKLPHLPKLDFRAEGFLTPPRAIFPGFYYFNVRYLSGYTNNRQLISSWIGREGSGVKLWGTWWFSPRVSLQANYRVMTANPEFLRGGDLHDASVASDLRLAREWSIHLSGQFERWQFPLLSPNVSDNMTVSAQLTWFPQPRSL